MPERLPDPPGRDPDPQPAGIADPPRPVIPPPVRDRLRRVRGVVFDMDGTLVLGDPRTSDLTPLPGAAELLRWLAAFDIPAVVLTNGTTRTPHEYAAELRAGGLPIGDDDVVTPASAAAEVFARRGYRRVLVLGNRGVGEPLAEAGIEPVPPAGRPAVDAVMVGWYREFTFDALEAACHAVWAGARLYSASQALYFATATGRAIGTSRAITAMIRSVTGCSVHVIGKPSLDALRAARRRLGVPMADLAVVGDDPDLEVPMAHRGGCLAVAVGTGIGDASSFADLPPRRRPHLSVAGVHELLGVFQALANPPR